MIIDHPLPQHIPQLRVLWKEAFGDSDAFLDRFFATGFDYSRCCCAFIQDRVAAALYFFPCSCHDSRIAYIYAVATDKSWQGNGLCRQLMHHTHGLLKEQGYAGAILVPGDAGLAQMYEKMGYRVCSHVTEFVCNADSTALPLRRVTTEEYAKLRRELLPDGGVVQEGESLSFLSSFCALWAGENLLLAAWIDGSSLQVAELLGDPGAAPGIVAALGCKTGHFRIPGSTSPFAMYHPLDHNPAPDYFGLAFD